MPAGLGQTIAEVLQGTGDAIERLRSVGAAIEVRDCTIEVLIEDPGEPVAHLRLRLEPPGRRDQPA